jgi:hypothetical protein
VSKTTHKHPLCSRFSIRENGFVDLSTADRNLEERRVKCKVEYDI